MQLFLPTTLLVLLSTRLASAAPLSPQRTPSISTSTCGILCQLAHLWTNEPIVTSFTSIDPIPVSDSTDGAQPYTDSQGPRTPTSSLTHASAALSANRPLSSSYLLSLSSSKNLKPASQRRPHAYKVNTFEIKEDSVKVAKMGIDITRLTSSTRPLHKLPKEEQANFWTTEHASRQHREKKKGCHGNAGYVYLPGNVYIQSETHDSHQMDLVVMGVVVLFLALLVCVEAAGTIKRQ